MRLRVEAMYVFDEHSRMTAINQWDGGHAPRFYLGRTGTGNICRFRFDVADELAQAISSLCETEPPLNNPMAAPAHQEHYVRLLAEHAPVESVSSGPAFRFPDAAMRPHVSVIAINQDNAELLCGGLDEWLPDVAHRQPFVAVVEDEHAVSLCASARITTAAHEAGVETLSEYRRRGHAVRAVSAWASAVGAMGATPFYSTSWDNLASQGLARALGLTMIGTNFNIT
ncbi:MAG: GNAT family N-acetyltransferase [Gammaproteobacteria bacterium]|nr:GNAT family N-acetyltransferase [Gammaproteobacteria bacterium]